MALRVPSSTRMPLPEPYSIAAPLYFVDITGPQIGQYIYLTDPYGKQSSATRMRGFNCIADLSDPDNCYIDYLAEGGQTVRFRPSKEGGYFPCVHWVVLEIGSAITNLQSFL